MSYEYGKMYTYTPPRGIVGQKIEPVWHALVVPPQKERATREYLRAQGIYAFYPSQLSSRTIRGKKITRERPMITQHVYARFTHTPQWDVLKEQRRVITGVYSIASVPIAIPSDVIRRLQGLTVEAERLREARAELLRVRAGDKAAIKGGPLAGFLVDVRTVSHGVAFFEFLTGGKGSAEVGSLERVLPDDA